MKAGSYDQKVIFRSFQVLPDGYGGTIPTWIELLTTFASVKISRAFDTTESGQLELPLIYTIRIQYRDSFTPTIGMRIVYKGKDVQIKSVQENAERLHREYILTGVTVD